MALKITYSMSEYTDSILFLDYLINNPVDIPIDNNNIIKASALASIFQSEFNPSIVGLENYNYIMSIYYSFFSYVNNNNIVAVMNNFVITLGQKTYNYSNIVPTKPVIAIMNNGIITEIKLTTAEMVKILKYIHDNFFIELNNIAPTLNKYKYVFDLKKISNNFFSYINIYDASAISSRFNISSSSVTLYNQISRIGKKKGVINASNRICYFMSSDFKVVFEVTNLDTVSYSIHKEKIQTAPFGYESQVIIGEGSRTIAGTLVFNFPDTNVLTSYLRSPFESINKNSNITSIIISQMNYNILNDQLNDFHLFMVAAPENDPFIAVSAIYGITIVDEGSPKSISDSIEQVTLQYLALDYEPEIIMSLEEFNLGIDIFRSMVSLRMNNPNFVRRLIEFKNNLGNK